MKTDLYTKAILTVIACCLIILVFQNFSIVPEMKANEPVFLPAEKISLQEEKKVLDINIVSINGEPVTVRKWGKYAGVPVYMLNPGFNP